ncbi:ABC transporter substrate-binding protein [Streptomyces triticagri]|uniref:ABC transporter substrate-binding protein n=1 Tax=Streptomyces triticagri TaxID=2293568 RepID=A0A372M4S2_9ACTN|nr:ABC transporter substrate-binding protein [Streptomyces triticagri]RFU85620.1 ABC transporter substrate-binding protein [Streptomyces triticagri]
MFTPRARRGTALLATAVAGVLVLAGCGSDDDSGSDKAAGGSDTRKVKDANGKSVEVPKAPKKVVTLSEPTLDAALALGIEPIGATAGRGQEGVSTYLADKASKADVVATVAEPDLEKLATLQPDLIVLDETVGSKRVLNKLQAIAPTVLTAKLNEDWKVAFKATADVLNKSSEADALLKTFDADVAKTKKGLGKNAKAVTSVIRWQDGAPSVVGKGEGHVGSTLATLGLERPKDQQGESAGRSEPVSLEKLDTIDGDWMFLGALGDKAAGEKAYKEAKKVPNFSGLKAEKEGHVVVIEGSAWNSAGGPIAARTVLDDVKSALAG